MKAFILSTSLFVICTVLQALDFASTKKLAESGNATAQYNLGIMYDNGDGVIEDDKLAVKWYTKAAEQGHASAQYNLGVMYFYGDGVIEDDIAAYAWLSNAKANGDKEAVKAIPILKKSMTKEQIAVGQVLAKKLFEETQNRDD